MKIVLERDTYLLLRPLLTLRNDDTLENRWRQSLQHRFIFLTYIHSVSNITVKQWNMATMYGACLPGFQNPLNYNVFLITAQYSVKHNWHLKIWMRQYTWEKKSYKFLSKWSTEQLPKCVHACFSASYVLSLNQNLYTARAILLKMNLKTNH